jgi:hypothetical protein
MRSLCFDFGDDIVELWSLLAGRGDGGDASGSMVTKRRDMQKRVVLIVGLFDRIRFGIFYC